MLMAQHLWSRVPAINSLHRFLISYQSSLVLADPPPS
jgi:hypothetical protein